MTPADARAMYRDQLNAHGEDIAIRRYTSTGAAPRTYVDRVCRARITGYLPSEIVGSITQGDRRVIVLAEDLEGESPPFAPTKSDKVVASRFVNDLAIISIDDSTRRIDGTLIAYEFQVRG